MEDVNKPVKMCICGNIPFAVLKELGVTSLDDAAERFGAGANCGLCRPYIEKMIQTGETEFEIIDT
jgi:bacterioferritin-associated ferredoxin